MKTRKSCLLSGGIFLLVIGLMVCAAGGFWWWKAGSPRLEQPSLRVFQPQPNANLDLRVPVAVQAAANVENGSVVRLRFYVDNLLSGEERGSANQLIGTWNWVPSSPGMHTLAFVALTDRGVENMLTLPVIVMAAVDRDGDSLPDEMDACPEQAGAEVNQGCPLPQDADGDGIGDAEDACPQEAGSVEQHGCLMGNRPDQDGDGTPDWEDRCPDQPGIPQWNGCPQEALLTDRDADGLIDAVDWCPDDPGSAENHGCPLVQAGDEDGDGVPDDQDECPGQPGNSRNGCPVVHDRDRDGIPDEEDSCPDNPNPNFACADVNPTDSDGDGVWDVLDQCDDQPGLLDNQGCPTPNDEDGDGIADEQDNCDSLAGPADNFGCPRQRNFPREAVQGKLICRLFPSLCPAQDPCQENPASCDSDQDGVNDELDRCPDSVGIAPDGCPVFPGDRDGDGAPDNMDHCPDQFGPNSNQGCPPDLDHDGVPDPDQDRDGVPDQQDSCPALRGMISNGGCPREEVDLTIYIAAFVVYQSYQNFYCYARLQDSPWVRIPEEGSLERSGLAYYVDQSVSLHLRGNELVTFELFCDGQENPFVPVQRVGSIARAHGPESWNSQVLYATSDNGAMLLEYRICEESCR